MVASPIYRTGWNDARSAGGTRVGDGAGAARLLRLGRAGSDESAFRRNERYEMKGKDSSKFSAMSEFAQLRGPLRRIVEVLRHADDAFGTSRVLFECEHETRASSGAIFKARCLRCRWCGPDPSVPPAS
jgi:hypothetical protein